MIEIEIQHVGVVRVLQMHTFVGNSSALVLVDRDPEADRGILDRYVVWNLDVKQHGVCYICNKAIERNNFVRWVNAAGQPADGHGHNPMLPITNQYYAFNGDYYATRLSAEDKFKERTGCR